MFRHALLACAAVLAAATGARAQAALDPPGAPIVIELFTSQGCSSCPPADAFLAELAQRPDVLPLSFHVDYWDYIGWKDPYAQRAFTKRQRDYARSMPARYVYTPQVIVDGRVQEVGSDRAAVETSLARVRGESPRRLALSVTGVGAKLAVTIDNPNAIAVSAQSPATVWFVTYDRVHSTEILRGENAGRTLESYNVVRRLDRIGSYTGASQTIALDLLPIDGDQRQVVIVQAGTAGAVLGVLPLGAGARP